MPDLENPHRPYTEADWNAKDFYKQADGSYKHATENIRAVIITSGKNKGKISISTGVGRVVTVLFIGYVTTVTELDAAIDEAMNAYMAPDAVAARQSQRSQ